MNEIVVMAVDALAEMIENPASGTPPIVELGRLARKRAVENDPSIVADIEATRWEIGREEILRLAESPDVSPEFREFLQKTDENVKRFRQKQGRYTSSKKRT